VNMSRTPRLPAALALTAVISLISAGCGSNAPSETGTAARASTGGSRKVTARDKAVKFAECIRDHGVKDFPDPNPKGDFEYGVSVSPAVWTRAVNACKALQPPGTLSAKRTPAQQSTALKFAQCMRDNGVPDFPDPTPDGPLIDTNRIPSAAGRGALSIPGFQAATEKCHDFAAGAGVTGGR
jgi:hypothetical protein